MSVFKSQKTPQVIGQSGWVSMLPRREPKPALQGNITADVAIIGGGFAGLAAARRLHQLDPTLKVVILEAHEMAQGAAGRNSGFVIDLPHEVSSEDYGGDASQQRNYDTFIQRTAIAMIREVAEEQNWGKDIFDPCGKYNVAMGSKGDAHVQSYARSLDKVNEEYKLLNQDEISAVTGSRAFTSAIYTPGTAIIQPAAYIRGLADSLTNPVTLYENTLVTSFESAGSGWMLKTLKGSVSTAKVILANNGHAQDFGLYRGRLLHVFTYASMTKAFSPELLGGERSWAATPAFPMGTTVRRVRGERGDRVLVRSRYTHHASQTISEKDIASAGRAHDAKYLARFPMLKDIPMEYRWGGAMALTWNGVPIFEEVERNLFAAIGCNGVGATKASALGMAAAEAALGMKSEFVKIFNGFAAPKKLPPQPFLSIGAGVKLKYSEITAGIE